MKLFQFTEDNGDVYKRQNHSSASSHLKAVISAKVNFLTVQNSKAQRAQDYFTKCCCCCFSIVTAFPYTLFSFASTDFDTILMISSVVLPSTCQADESFYYMYIISHCLLFSTFFLNQFRRNVQPIHSGKLPSGSIGHFPTALYNLSRL